MAKYAQENKLDVAEMRMLGWMCGVKKLNNRIRNKRIRRTTKMGGNDSPSGEDDKAIYELRADPRRRDRKEMGKLWELMRM